MKYGRLGLVWAIRLSGFDSPYGSTGKARVQDNAKVWLYNNVALHRCESSIELIRDSRRMPSQKDHLGNKRA